MYGLYDAAGNADYEQLRQVISAPKAFFEARPEWQWPGQKLIAETKAKEQLEHEERREKWLTMKAVAMQAVEEEAATTAEPTAEHNPCHESIEELLQLPSMTGSQIARMRGIASKPRPTPKRGKKRKPSSTRAPTISDGQLVKDGLCWSCRKSSWS